MCGIAGIARIAGDAPIQRGELEAMIHALHHRGPDGYGYFLKDKNGSPGDIGLAHARLSIIDLSTGDQPIHNEDKTVWTVFNGEIFNYIELRRDLERFGHKFYTSSDTEVIVHAYEQYGDRFVDHLNGQFAIALWDDRRKRLVLARDRAGIRPLFFAQVNGRLLFGSELKSLFAIPALKAELDPQSLSQIFTYWSPLQGNTAFKGVHALLPGELMALENGKFTRIRYWDWQFPDGRIEPVKSAEEYAEELRALLIDAVRLQLRADVPVGAYLSGGLDSSIITSIIKNFTDTPLRTFSLTFEDAEFDESAHQKELVDYLGTKHSELKCRTTDIGAAFPKAIWHTEIPIVRTAPTPMMLLSGKVRAEKYKVVLTGEGADEVFGGYDLFKEAKIRRFMARAPQSKWRGRILDRLYGYLKNSPAASSAMASRFFAEGIEHINEPFFAHVPRWITTQRVQRFFSPAMTESIGAFDPYAAVKGTFPAGIGKWSPLARDQYVEAHTLMAGYLLCSQGDRVGMANSIEGRFPFLDHRVIEFANRLPARYKINGLTEKYLLKKAMHDYLPPGVRSRTKQPYRAPDSASFFVNGVALDYVNEVLSPEKLSQAGYFEPQAVAKLLEKARQGKVIGFADNMAFVGILSTMLLHRQFVKKRGLAA
jgi:asparagine synthase (glutamine-hydrolysing)